MNLIQPLRSCKLYYKFHCINNNRTYSNHGNNFNSNLLKSN